MSVTENKYKVLLLTSTSFIGGTERMVFNFLSLANREKFEYHILSLFGDESLTSLCSAEGFPAVNLSRSESPFLLMSQLLK
ncbi:MAG: hypothetical protein N2246_10140, partial [Candidatus Sumerlaeia bacterium]|nr:hypothetical protein [Candidatus Sumerlaeia bacterium]